MKILNAKLKESPQIEMSIDFDFTENWLLASTLLEGAKKKMLYDLKNKLHEKIATLSLDDIEFKITRN